MSNWHDACDLIKSKAKEDFPSVPRFKISGGTPMHKLASGTQGTPARKLSLPEMEELRTSTAEERKASRPKPGTAAQKGPARAEKALKRVSGEGAIRYLK